MLGNHYQTRNTSSNIYDFHIDEVSYDTESLVTTRSFLNQTWKNYPLFKELVNNFGVRIVTFNTVSPEWGQDYIRKIKIDSQGNKYFELLTQRPNEYFDEEFRQKFPNSIYNLFSKNKNTNRYNLDKGGNFLVLPNEVTGTIPCFENDCFGIDSTKKIITMLPSEDLYEDFCIYNEYLALKLYLPNFDISKCYGDDVFHIDEILTIIPTSSCTYDIWLYNPICTEDKNYHHQLQDIFNYNYNFLKIFFSKENIKLFELKFSPNGKIINPPIFNRILLRKNDSFRIFFPSQPDMTLTTQVITEMEKIIRNYPKIDYFFIDSCELHNLNGNLHCGFKNVPNIQE